MSTPFDDGTVLCSAAFLLTARIERQDYSSSPWRVVSADGSQLTLRTPYPGWRGSEEALPPIDAPICADTKREAEAILAGMRAASAEAILQVASRLRGVPA